MITLHLLASHDYKTRRKSICIVATEELGLFQLGILLQFKARFRMGTAATFLTTSFAKGNWFSKELHEREVRSTEHYFSCYNFHPLASQNNSWTSTCMHLVHWEPWIGGSKPKHNPLPSSTNQNTKPIVQSKSGNVSQKQGYGLRYRIWRREQNKI